MLKHTVSGGLNGGPRHVSQDPRGFAPSEIHRIYRSPPSQAYNGGPNLNLSAASSAHLRSFSNGNPYSNTSTLSTSKHSGGTPASVSPMANGGLHISRPPPSGGQPPPLPPPSAAYYDHRGNYSQPALNISTLSTSKHSLGGNSSSVSPLGMATVPRLANGGLNISRLAPPPSTVSTANKTELQLQPPHRREPGVREMLTSLGLLCLVSLLLALLSLVFMLKISPVTAADVKDFLRSDQLTVISPEEYVLVYEVTLALCALSLSLNLCCLLVCAVQFLFAVKLVRDSPDGERTNKYLRKSAFTRVCAVGGFFVSIPVFLTGIILYTFIQFHSTPALITSVLIGLGIIFCGCAMVHNVFVWQKEKTNAVRALAQQQRLALQQEQSFSDQPRLVHSSLIQNSGSISPGLLPCQTHLDISNRTPTPPEICTLV